MKPVVVPDEMLEVLGGERVLFNMPTGLEDQGSACPAIKLNHRDIMVLVEVTKEDIELLKEFGGLWVGFHFGSMPIWSIAPMGTEVVLEDQTELQESPRDNEEEAVPGMQPPSTDGNVQN